MNDKKLIYLYCVTDKEPLLGKASELTDHLYSINFNEIYAVISEVSKLDFEKDNLEKNIANMEWLENQVRIHESVIDATLSEKQLALVPFKFATVFYNTASLKSFIADYSESLLNNLLFLSDKEEWGVKIYCDNNRLEKSILENDPSVKKMDEEISASAPGKAFFIKKKKLELIKDLLHNKTNEYGKECFQNLKKLSVQAKINKLQSKELTGKETDMILNAVFLVDGDNIPEFTDIVLDLKNKYNSMGLDIDCTGPWPAYNFCKIDKPVSSEQ
ncbi:MAG: GvpL/GvpF family gas vesicle protein [Victivallales bacterium]|nr:GvpL/GvpF family gas vesicle protein [Victivallales bacterium]